jgi:hypothetical protein
MKTQGQRQSKNVIDLRDPNFVGKRGKLGENSKRQIFNPEVSTHMTSVVNRLVNKNRNSNGPGAKTLRSPPGKVASTFKKKGK